MKTRLLLTAVALGLTALPLQAQSISGLVVTPQGVGLAGVDIDVLGEDGDDPDVSQDFTVTGGTFNTQVTPGGTFEVVFNPPLPYLTKKLPDVAIFGATNLGTIQLEEGVILTGRCVDALGNPVTSVNLDIIDALTGVDLDPPGDSSGPTGVFTVNVPMGPLEVRFDTSGQTGQVLASTAVAVDTSGVSAGGTFDMGDVLMPPGFRITTVIRNSQNQPVEGVDTDTVDATTGETIYTPGDSSSSNGLVSVTVPAGTYDFQVCPNPNTLLQSKEIAGLTLGPDVNLGITTLDSGVLLSGSVALTGGGSLQGVDVDAVDTTTGLPVFACNDNTNPSGTYQFVVPTGTYDVIFTPPYSAPFGSDESLGVLVTGNTTVNGLLPACPSSISYGSGTPGTGGLVPAYATSGGSARLGNPDYAFHLSNGVGGGLAAVFVGFGAGSLPFKGGVILVDLGLPNLLIFLPLSGPAGLAGAGALTIPAPVPEDPALVGASVFTQFIVQDAGAPVWPLAFSNGLQITYCD